MRLRSTAPSAETPTLPARSAIVRRRRARVALAAFSLLLAAPFGAETAQAAGWSPAASPATAKLSHAATRLQNGKVLVSGGGNSLGSVATVELYDPATNTWSAAASLATARGRHTATLLANGKVLVSGGGGAGIADIGGTAARARIASAELYDPATNTWSAAGNLTTAREQHKATLLTNGKVLVTGGRVGNNVNTAHTATAELYDPATNTWSAASSMAGARGNHSATLLTSGKVLVAGGLTLSAGALASAELYDPGSNTWTQAANMSTRRNTGAGVLLSSGKVLVVAGGSAGSGNTADAASAELYDPTANTWSRTGNLINFRTANEHTATLLSNGKVLVAGGDSENPTSELFDPVSSTWSPAGNMTATRFSPTATLLPGGTVLAVGGSGSSLGATAELYTPKSAAPTMQTNASPDVPIGGSITDTATLSGESQPTTGNVTFRAFGPDDSTCSGTPAVTSTVAINSDGTATSKPFTPATRGTYRWIAVYEGDAVHDAASGVCNAPNETVTVTEAKPKIATATLANIPLGGQVSDNATVGGRVDPRAGATIDFRLYGPEDTTCSDTPVFESLDVPYPVAGGPVRSEPYTPTRTGTHRWRATYSGDTNNASDTGACDDPKESVVVNQVTPTIATTASSDITVGSGQLTDSAAVSGRMNPEPGATIDFRLYGPADTRCSNAPVFESLDVPYPVGGGAVTSAAFTPTTAGTYRWRATYSGDETNASIAGACNDANESVIVGRAAPTIETKASPSITVGGGQLTDSATVSGRVNPQSATIDFSLYGPGDATCSDSPVFQSLNVPFPVVGDSVTSAAFTPASAGTYRWRATYSGDANNAPASGRCNDAGENVEVSGRPVPPKLPTCQGRTATIVATAGQTVITGTEGADVIVGGNATETIAGRGGDDLVCAGEGNDHVVAGAGNDRINGDAGKDRLSGDAGRDLLRGGHDDDTLRGGSGNDRLGGEGGQDGVHGDAGKDRLSGDGGRDLLRGGHDDDTLRGGGGNDRLGGGGGQDRVHGDAGNDALDEMRLGGLGRDRLYGGSGRDRVRTAGGFRDRVDCGSGRDSVIMDVTDGQKRCESVVRAKT